jgi:hypothetical protein
LDQVKATLTNLSVGEWVTHDLFQRVQRAVSETRWQQLKDAVASELPDRTAPLSDAEVLGRLRALARQVVRDWPQDRRQQLSDDAPGTIMAAFANFNRTRPFSPWARQVLWYHAIDELRRDEFQDHRPAEALDGFAASWSSDSRTWADLVGMLDAFRSLFNRIVFFPDRADGVDYYAAIILEFRLRLAQRLGFDAAVLEQHLPWAGWELPRRIKPGWPTLGQLWRWLLEHCTAESRPADVVARACKELTPVQHDVLLEFPWNTWINRAKKKVQESIASGPMMDFFAALFPNRSGNSTRSAS